jgi:hypothetical protein
VSYVTGTVAVTLGALPDVGGEIILNWGSRVNYINRAAASLPPLKIPLQLAQTGITPGTVVITWNDGTARTASDDGKGNISGSATGTIRYQTGLIQLQPTLLPAGGQIYTVDYAFGPPDVQEFPAPLRDINGEVPLTLSKANLRPNTVEVTWNLLYNPYDPVTMTAFPPRDPYKTVRDDGLGRLRDTLGADHGTVNYTTGILSLKTETTVGMPRAQYAWVSLGNSPQGFAMRRWLFQGWEYYPVGANMPNDESAHVSVKYRTMDADSSISAPIATGALKFDLTNQYSENIVPGSVNFTMGGKTYFDRAGNLYYNLDVATGNATKAGTLNYQSGEVTLDAWTTGASAAVSVKSMLTSMDGHPVDEVTFRAPVAPLRTGSVQVLATRLAGGLVNVSANTSGDFVGVDVSGHVDYETGVVRLRFGAYVVAAGNETQVWYSAAGVWNGWQDLQTCSRVCRHHSLQRSGFHLPAIGCGHPRARPGPPATGRKSVDLSTRWFCRSGPHRQHHRYGLQWPGHQLRSGAPEPGPSDWCGRQCHQYWLHRRPGGWHGHVHVGQRLRAARGGGAPD